MSLRHLQPDLHRAPHRPEQRADERKKAAVPNARREVVSVSCSPRTIIELNLKFYRDLLKTETDPAKRRTIATLLAEEEAKLVKLIQQLGKDDKRR